MRRSTTLLVASALTTACAATGTKVVTAGGELAPVSPPNGSWIPAGTSMLVKLNQTLGTATSHTGDTFTATVANPVVAQDAFVAIPAGSLLRGRITGIHISSNAGEQSIIRLAFEDLQLRGQTYPVSASISNLVVEKPIAGATTSPIVRNATIISGAELSRIIASGVLGTAVGTVISLGPGGTETVIPAGSSLTVRTSDNIVVR